MTTATITDVDQQPVEQVRPRGDKLPRRVTDFHRFLILDAIVATSNDHGFSTLTVAELSERTNIPETTVRRHLKALVSDGKLVRSLRLRKQYEPRQPGRRLFEPAATAVVANNAEGVRAVRQLAHQR